MQVGDLVTDPLKLERCFDGGRIIGIVVDLIDDFEVPPVVRVLWSNGDISKTYQDELEVVDENIKMDQT